MNFRDYKWFKNPRGLHNNGPYSPLNTTRYTGPKMGWAKLVVGGTEQVEGAQRLVGQGCMPIVRIFRERMGSMPALDTWYDIYRQYFDVGCRWFEFYDEPNLETSWAPAPGRGAITIDWNNSEWCIKPLMDNWLDWAERIIDIGGYPAFPAMAETVEPRQATIAWLDACLKYLRENQPARFASVVTNGLWCATHPYLLNHFYQEPPSGPSYVARPYYQQSAAEGRWHFEYPYDPLQQRDDPGRTIFGGTLRTPQGDPNGLVATGQAFQELLKKIFDAGPVPIIGTAGGIGPLPGPNDDPAQQDKRYPPFSRDSHAEATLAMWRWIVHQGPPWLFGLTLSAEAEYYDRHGASPAIELMLTEQPLLKEVPDLEITVGMNFEEQLQPPQPELVAPAVHPVDAMPEPVIIEEPDLMAALDAVPEPPGDTTDEMMLFTGSEHEPETPSLDAVGQSPTAPLADEEVAFEPILFEEPRMGPKPPSAVDEMFEEILFTEAETAPETPSPDAIGQSPIVQSPIASEQLAFDGPEPEAEAPVLETFAPLPTELDDVEPPLPEEPRPMPEAPQFETVTDLPIAAPDAPYEAAVSEPVYFEEPVPEFVSEEYQLEPIPFEEFDDDELAPDGPTIEMVLPELAWDYAEPSRSSAPASVDVKPPVEPVAEKVLPQQLQDAATVDDLVPGPPPEKLDYHFLMVAQGLSPDWLFQSVLRYWQTFRPALLPQPEMIGLLPAGKSIAVTLLATRSTVREAHRLIHDQWPDVYIDPAICDTQEAMRAEMDRRALQERRFGGAD